MMPHTDADRIRLEIKMTTKNSEQADWTTISEGAFTGPVSRDENPAAHGGICRLERRGDRLRRVNINGPHREYGEPWVACEEDASDD